MIVSQGFENRTGHYHQGSTRIPRILRISQIEQEVESRQVRHFDASMEGGAL